MTQKLFVETARTLRRANGWCEAAEVREATPNEIRDFRSYPCDHTAPALLVYDVRGWDYDIRHCGACDAVLGLI